MSSSPIYSKLYSTYINVNTDVEVCECGCGKYVLNEDELSEDIEFESWPPRCHSCGVYMRVGDALRGRGDCFRCEERKGELKNEATL